MMSYRSLRFSLTYAFLAFICVATIDAQSLNGTNIGGGGFPPLGFKTATGDIVRPRTVVVTDFTNNNDGSITISTSSADPAVLLKLDQTAPQTINNGIPLLNQAVPAFNSATQLVNKGYVDSAISSAPEVPHSHPNYQPLGSYADATHQHPNYQTVGSYANATHQHDSYVPYSGAIGAIDFNGQSVKDFFISKVADTTAKFTFDVSGLSGGNTRTIGVPNRSLTLDNVTTSTTTNGTGFVTGNGTNVAFDNSYYVPYTNSTKQHIVTNANAEFVSTHVAGIPMPDLFNISNHYTGFQSHADGVLSFNEANQTFTLTATGIPIWIDGRRYAFNTGSVAVTNTTGLYWIYIDIVGGVPTLQFAQSIPDQFSKCLVATVYWNAQISHGIVGDERHWFGRDKWWHEYTHETIGARYHFGLTGTFTNTTLSVTTGDFYDEDIEHTINLTTVCDVLYKNGASTFEFNTTQSTPYKATAGVLQYNNGNTLTSVPSNSYVAYWVYATPSTTNGINVVIGQRVDGNIANARTNNTPDTLSIANLPSPEMKLLYRVIYRNVGGTATYIETADYRNVTPVPNGSFTPTDHSTLSKLNWSQAGHSFDTDLDVNPYAVKANSMHSATTATGALTAGATSVSSLDITGLTDGYVPYVSPYGLQHSPTQVIQTAGGSLLQSDFSATNSTKNERVFRNNATNTVTSDISANWRCSANYLTTDVSAGKTLSGEQYGHENFVTKTGAGTAASLVNFQATMSAGGPVTNWKGYSLSGYGGYASTTGSLFGYHIADLVASTTITNFYGFYQAAQTLSGAGAITNRYGVYINDALAINYMAYRLGIGISAPLSHLDVQGTGVAVTGPTNIQALIVDSTAMAADVGGALGFRGKQTAAGAYAYFAAIKGAKENATEADYASYLAFYTRANGGNLTEQMRITSAGLVGIGTIPTDKLHISSAGVTGYKLQTTADNSFAYNILLGGTKSSYIYQFGNTYSTSGRYVAGSMLLDSRGTELGIASLSGGIKFYTGDTVKATLSHTGDLSVNGDINATAVHAQVSTGTAPFQTVSTTLNTNLNADLLDGYHSTALPYANATHTHSNYQPTGDYATTTQVQAVASIATTNQHNASYATPAQVTAVASIATTNTHANATASAAGFLPTLSNTSTTYLNGTGNWTTPSGGGSGGNILGATPFESVASPQAMSGIKQLRHMVSSYENYGNVICDGLSDETGISQKTNMLYTGSSDYNYSTSGGYAATIPTMVDPTTPSGTASEDSYAGGAAYRGFAAMDKNNATFWQSSSSAVPHWISYDYGAGVSKVGVRYKIRNATNTGFEPKNWVLEGSNTGAFGGEQTTLDTQTNIDTEWAAGGQELYFTFSNTTAYRYYRLYVTATNYGPGTYVIIDEWEIYNLNSAVTGNIHTIAYPVPSTPTHIGVSVKMDSTFPVYANQHASMKIDVSRDGGATFVDCHPIVQIGTSGYYRANMANVTGTGSTATAKISLTGSTTKKLQGYGIYAE